MTKEEFLTDTANWNNHKFCLWPALEATDGLVVEFGAGHGSTPSLYQYCKDNNRHFLSYDFNSEWADKFKDYGTRHVENWDLIGALKCDVILIDHSPGERRWVDIERFANSAKIIVIHDSEPAATGYMLNKIWHLFKYRVDYKTEGAWASAVSNFLDVSKWQIS